MFVGSGLIAADRRANALQVYLSKPLLRMEYIAGKLAILATFLTFVTIVPALLLIVLQVSFSGSLEFLKSNLFLIPAVVLASLARVIVSSFAMLALSSLSKSTRYVAILYAGIDLLHGSRCSACSTAVTDSTRAAWISLSANLENITDVMFRQTPRYETPVIVSVLVLLGPDRGVDFGARAARARCRGGRVSAPDPHGRPSLEVVRPGHRPERRQRVACRRASPGLLGPNGAGKSTFMKLITGQLRPSKGDVKVLGEPIWGNPKLFFRIGFCPEQDAFYDRMTGLQWVTALVRLNGLSEAEARAAAERALGQVDLLEAANKRIGAYSKGMRQRVKLAQALVHDPELLILDEPLGGMDPLGRRRTMKMIREWAKQGKSILVSSHILHEIESITSNILLINNGRILAEGNVHQIRDLIDTHPHTVYIRAENPRDARP